MNKDRRAQLAKATKFLEAMESARDDALEIIRQCAEDEREAFDNMTEGLQNGERGSKIGENADALEAVADELENMDFNNQIENGSE